MARLFVIVTALCCLLGAGGCGTSAVSWQHSAFGSLKVRNAPAALLPLLSLETKYADNTKMSPDTQFTDSFLIETCNALLAFECGKQFNAVILHGEAPENDSEPADTAVDDITISEPGTAIAGAVHRPRYSILTGDTANLKAAGEMIRGIARTAGTELVLVPYACTIKYNVYKPAGWREDKYEGGSYTRPTTYMAVTSFHLQLWTKDGKLLFEKIGTSVTDRPLFYTVFHKEQPTGSDIVGFAKRIYAPPLIKSLYKAMKVALILI